MKWFVFLMGEEDEYSITAHPIYASAVLEAQARAQTDARPKRLHPGFYELLGSGGKADDRPNRNTYFISTLEGAERQGYGDLIAAWRTSLVQPVQWLCTNPSGKSHTHGADDGRTGWKWHAVEATEQTTLQEVKRRRALCGLLPRNGWTLDLFMDTNLKCKRCVERIALR